MTGTVAPPHTQMDARDRFDRFAAEWRAKSRHMSNAAQMAILRSYQSIIGMGDAAVPLMLEELKKRPEQWFWALEVITLEDPVPEADRGYVDRMAAAWVSWGVANGTVSA